jgi:error-prone DNA polymerase
VECSVAGDGSIRIGLGYVLGVRRDDVAALVAARAAAPGGRFGDVGDLASRAGAGAPSLEGLAWSGACDALAGGDRRIALWRLGITAPGRKVREGVQLSLPLDAPEAPELRPVGAWEEVIADYATTGVSARAHPLALLRPELPEDAVTAADLHALPHGRRVRIAGQVVARQRPGTAKGVVFLLIEDETGTVNIVVPPPLYERRRLTVRTEPLILIEGRLEKLPAAGGAINVLMTDVFPLEAPDRPLAQVKDFSPLEEASRRRVEEEEQEGRANDFRAVAPPVMSFASGRRR